LGGTKRLKTEEKNTTKKWSTAQQNNNQSKTTVTYKETPRGKRAKREANRWKTAATSLYSVTATSISLDTNFTHKTIKPISSIYPNTTSTTKP